MGLVDGIMGIMGIVDGPDFEKQANCPLWLARLTLTRTPPPLLQSFDIIIL